MYEFCDRYRNEHVSHSSLMQSLPNSAEYFARILQKPKPGRSIDGGAHIWVG